jgi:hypothetical protein
MSRTTMSASMHKAGGLLLLSLLALSLLTASRAGAAEVGQEDTGPIIAATSLTPASLPPEGGTITITATVEDDFGVAMAYAEIYGPELFRESVQLIPFEVSPTGVITFAGTFNAPPNLTDSPLGYGVEIQATDTNGAFATRFLGEVQVEATPKFDEAPFVSDPTVAPRQLPASGGELTLAVDASDDRALAGVFAIVTRPDGTTVEVPLESTGPSRFEGTFAVAANAETTAKQYAIQFVAEDDIGQTTNADGGLATVAGAPVPTHRGCRDRGGKHNRGPTPPCGRN